MGSDQNGGTSVPPSEPKLCANGCGFFGTAANMNLCSKCYRDLRAEEEQAASAKAAMEKTFNIQLNSENFKIAADSSIVQSLEESVAAVVEDKPGESSSSSLAVEVPPVVESRAANRCFSCNQKVGLTGFKCKCGSTFCGSHRYPENHQCSFDFKGTGRDAIAKANPVVKADKVERI